MELHPRELAFLENEMENIIEAEDRRHSEKEHASTILGRVRGEIEWEAEQHTNGPDVMLPETE